MSYGGQQNRTEWYDRNPIPRVNAYFSGPIAPAGSVTRWSYTVPALKKFLLQTLQTLAIRETVAGVVNAGAAAIAAYTPSGSGLSQFQVAPATGTNTIGSGVSVAFGANAVFLAGDLLQGISLDSSTGGTIGFIINMSGLEYDA